MTTTIALTAGILISIGIWVVIAGLRRTEPTIRPHNATPPFSGILRLLGMTPGGPLYAHRRLIAITATTGLAIGILTGWYILTIILPTVMIGLPSLFRRTTSSTEVETLTDLTAWIRSLIGALAGGAVGLEQAIRATLGAAPSAIQPAVARLVARLEAQQPIKPALLRWAEEMNDYSADLIAATLILESDNRAGAITKALRELADSLNVQAKARRAIENERSSGRATVRWVTMITIVILLGTSFTGLLARYNSPAGQILALVLFLAYVSCLMWMRAISIGKPIPRFLPATSTGD